ncbi:MAG: hypothetical protein AAFV86_13165 [Pseudomonadota bacterium]
MRNEATFVRRAGSAAGALPDDAGARPPTAPRRCGPSRTLHLGAGETVAGALDPGWLLGAACELHRWGLVDQLGTAPADLRDAGGRPVVAMLTSLALDGRLDPFVDGTPACLTLLTPPSPASAWRSRTILSGLAHHAVTVDLVTTFVTRDDAAGGVLRPSRMAAALAARSEGEPAARTEVIAARRAAMRHRARRVLAEPQLNRRVFAGGDGAVTGLAFCPDLVAFFREAEARAAPAVVARYVPVAREIHLWGSVARGQALDLGARTSADRPGSAVAVTLETAARHGDGTLLATGTARFERV